MLPSGRRVLPTVAIARVLLHTEGRLALGAETARSLLARRTCRRQRERLLPHRSVGRERPTALQLDEADAAERAFMAAELPVVNSCWASVSGAAHVAGPEVA